MARRRIRSIWVPSILGIPSILGAGGWVGLVASAQGSMISYDLTWGPASQSTTIPLSFPTFNTSLGNLQSVTIGGNASMAAVLRILNLNSFPVSFNNGNVSEPITVTNGNGSTFSETVTQIVAAGNLSGTAAAGPGNVSSFYGNSTIVAFTPANIATNEFGTFESPDGSATVNVAVTTGNVTEGCNFIAAPAHEEFSSGDATVQGDVEVDYTYTIPVPEPAGASLILLGSTLTLSGRRQSRRRQKSRY